MCEVIKSWLQETGTDPHLLEAEGIDQTVFAKALEDIRSTCRDAWQIGLMSGYNGNMSIKLSDTHILITASGVAKGHLQWGDISLASFPEGKLLAGRNLSSETAMHLAVYKTRKKTARCILHTHPSNILVLSLHFREFPGKMLDMPLYEAKAWKEKLSFALSCEPGSIDLADAVGRASKTAPAVCMIEHGLCVAAKTPVDAIAISEQLEHIASMQMLVL